MFGCGAIALQKATKRRCCYAADIGANAEKKVFPWQQNWDGLENNRGEKGAVRHIILIREAKFDPHVWDKNLTFEGRMQASQLGKYLGDLSKELKLPVTKVVRSSMVRARETCNTALTTIPPEITRPCEIVEELFDEGPPYRHDPPDLEYKPCTSIIATTTERLDKAIEKHFFRPQKGQSIEFYFLHANVIRYIVCKLLQFPLHSWMRFSLKHCSVTHLQIRHNGWALIYAFGDTGWMKVDNISS